MYNIGIRTDGGPNMGIGHVMRCLSLAKALRKRGHSVIFLCIEREGIARIKEEAFEVIELEHENSHKAVAATSKPVLYGEIQQLIRIIQEKAVQMLIIDKYDVETCYFLKIRPYVKRLVYLDDLGKFVYPVDLVVNGSITSEYLKYKGYSKEQHLLLGTAYNLLRDEFRELPDRKLNKAAQQIMITTGGSDPYHMTLRFLNMMMTDPELAGLTIHVIVGSLFTCKEELKKIQLQNPFLVLYENITHIWRVMLQADIAISAGGTTLYELAACGMPTLAVILAENQKMAAEKMDEKGCVMNLGWFDQIETDFFLSQLKRLMYDYSLRASMSKRAKKLIDGKGAERVADYIEEMMAGI